MPGQVSYVGVECYLDLTPVGGQEPPEMFTLKQFLDYAADKPRSPVAFVEGRTRILTVRKRDDLYVLSIESVRVGRGGIVRVPLEGGGFAYRWVKPALDADGGDDEAPAADVAGDGGEAAAPEAEPAVVELPLSQVVEKDLVAAAAEGDDAPTAADLAEQQDAEADAEEHVNDPKDAAIAVLEVRDDGRARGLLASYRGGLSGRSFAVVLGRFQRDLRWERRNALQAELEGQPGRTAKRRAIAKAHRPLLRGGEFLGKADYETLLKKMDSVDCVVISASTPAARERFFRSQKVNTRRVVVRAYLEEQTSTASMVEELRGWWRELSNKAVDTVTFHGTKKGARDKLPLDPDGNLQVRDSDPFSVFMEGLEETPEGCNFEKSKAVDRMLAIMAIQPDLMQPTEDADG